MKRFVLAGWSLFHVSLGLAQFPAAVWVETQTAMAFVKVGKGCYRMGIQRTPFRLNSQYLTEVGYKSDVAADEKPEHEVCLSAFWIGVHEVRADEWQVVMDAPPPLGRGKEPASGVSWRDAVSFAERLTARSNGTAVYRLPTEAEWEIACLAEAPQKSRRPARPVPDTPVLGWDVGKTAHRAPKPRETGKSPANALGIHDMLGNVWEWVQDTYDASGYTRHSLHDPLIRTAGSQNVIRGGSHRSEGHDLRCTNRAAYAPAESLPTIGLRLVREEKP